MHVHVCLIIYISQNAIQVCEYTETEILIFLEIVNHWAFNTVTYTDQTQKKTLLSLLSITDILTSSTSPFLS